ncbi:MAG TPA: WYL domain-containing protein [Acidimicrobiales bacterium]|nr:WYL domain-containing protein [Acidimicrobiales bacterium]
MNRTDRLYALVEELRAVAPRPRTARQLADRFEVSVRTIERDLGALMEAGVPLYATPGPGGGHAIDPVHTLPPVNFTSDEAAALAIALARPGRSPLAGALRSALRKVVAAMPSAEAARAERLAGRVHVSAGIGDRPPPAARVVEHAVVRSRVVAIDYRDRHGAATRREVEPVALVGGRDDAWYLVGHCRLRNGERVFRLDRVEAAALTGEPAPEREYAPGDDIPLDLRRLSLAE